mmetsp:Transcript_121530/g.343822  ORF Transcript_121530/g.343822 Transcript_121530/m.343822 type:complete len:211 (+) Transcript_121530:610-1242(+)
MSHTSSTRRMSTAVSSSSSSAFFGAITLFAAVCFPCHSLNFFVQSACCSLNHSEGCSPSILAERFRSTTNLCRYSLLTFSFCHSKRTSSKPSALSGMEKCTKALSKTCCVRSGLGDFACKISSSSGVSSAASGSPSSLSSSSSSFSFSSSSFFPSSFSSSFCSSSSSAMSSSALALSAFLLASANFFWAKAFTAASFFLFSSSSFCCFLA